MVTARLMVSRKKATVPYLLRRICAEAAYSAIKKLVWESQFKDWQDYATLELNLQESLAQTEDFKEGVRAHSERRRPKFTGK